MILALVSPHCIAGGGFSSVAPFFDRTAYEKGLSKEEFKPKNCPDGSKFIVLDFNPAGATGKSEVATCLYNDEKRELVVEHVWEQGEKVGEYSTIDNVLVGPEIIKMKGGFYIVSEHCFGKLIRQEILDESLKVLTVFLFIDSQDIPDVFISTVDSSKNKNTDKVKEFRPCDYAGQNVANKAFNKWLNREWFPLSLQPTH